MTLSPTEHQRLQYLLGKQQVQHWLAPEERDELRRLLTRENPAMAQADWDALVKFGLLMVGTYLLLRALASRS